MGLEPQASEAPVGSPHYQTSPHMSLPWCRYCGTSNTVLLNFAQAVCAECLPREVGASMDDMVTWWEEDVGIKGSLSSTLGSFKDLAASAKKLGEALVAVQDLYAGKSL